MWMLLSIWTPSEHLKLNWLHQLFPCRPANKESPQNKQTNICISMLNTTVYAKDANVFQGSFEPLWALSEKRRGQGDFRRLQENEVCMTCHCNLMHLETSGHIDCLIAFTSWTSSEQLSSFYTWWQQKEHHLFTNCISLSMHIISFYSNLDSCKPLWN